MIKIFAAESSRVFAERVCVGMDKYLKADHKGAEKAHKRWIEGVWGSNKGEKGRKAVSLGRSRTIRFSDGEIKTVIDECVRGRDCFIIHAPSPSPAGITESTFASLIMIDALRQAKAGSVTLVSPYLPFSRQDHLVDRESLTIALLAKLYAAAGLDRLITVNLHSPQIAGMFDVAGISTEHIHAEHMLAERFLEDNKVKDVIVASPDAGGAGRAKAFAKVLGTSAVMCIKRRDPDNVNAVDKVEVLGEVKGKRVIVVDDIIDTAGTMEAVAKSLVEKGAREVVLAGVHGILSGPGIGRISSMYHKGIIKKVYVADSIPRDEVFMKEHPWYMEVSLAGSIAENICKVSYGPHLRK